MGWLQQGLAKGDIAFNETGAMVHFAAEGMLLISPRIFRHFAERFGEKGDGTPSSLTGDKLGTGIQREVIKAGWHLLGPSKTNVHKYQVVRRNGKGGSQLSVMIIREPQRFIEPVPPANPHLVRSESNNWLDLGFTEDVRRGGLAEFCAWAKLPVLDINDSRCLARKRS
jgi:hypothetical protein